METKLIAKDTHTQKQMEKIVILRHRYETYIYEREKLFE